MKKLTIIIIFFFVFLASVYTQSNTIVEVKGLGDIINGKIDIAFDKAVETALRMALEKAVGTYVSQEALFQNGALLEDTIFKKSEGFIKTYEVISQEIDKENEIMWVTIKAEVISSEVEQTLKDLLESVGTISTFVNIEGNETFRLKLINDLINNGVKVIDQEMLQSVLDKQKAAMQLDDSKNLEEVGLWFWSKFIVRGTATHRVHSIEFYGNQTEMITFEYNIEIFDTTNGDNIGNFTDVNSREGIANPILINSMVEESIDSIKGFIPKLFLDYSTSKKVVDLIAIDVNNLEKALREIPGITSLEHIETYGERVKYKMRYSGNLNTLLKRITEMGFQTEQYQNCYYIRAVSKKIFVKLEQCSFLDVKVIRDQLGKLKDFSFSNNTISFTLEGDVYVVAEIINNLGFTISQITDQTIEATK